MSLNWFKSYLFDRKQKCNVNGLISSERSLLCGVPQGSILGPLLFLVYINDLPSCLQHSTARMYTDDTNITTTGKSIKEIASEANTDLENICIWLKANKLTLNVTKTEYMFIASDSNLDKLRDRPFSLRLSTSDHGKLVNSFLNLSTLRVEVFHGSHINNAMPALSFDSDFAHNTTTIKTKAACLRPVVVPKPTSPGTSPRTSPSTSPGTSPRTSPSTSPRTSRSDITSSGGLKTLYIVLIALAGFAIAIGSCVAYKMLMKRKRGLLIEKEENEDYGTVPRAHVQLNAVSAPVSGPV
ncbi:Hypothetical predicted protein [Paramuricea clavata]|uniref:Uncharacterized protein n=1 Tax=Paramuricea clavata TaxID=317549 RepID=A0A6S7IX08_PARCT|nr:Hypothetical predicted protein [Paramuricea clavata]